MVRLLLALMALVLLFSHQAEAGEPVTLFAAASLTDAVDAIAAAYEEQGGAAPRISYAASSTLARQIEAGAPAAIFLSANSRWMDHLEDQGLLLPGSRQDVLRNRLVLVVHGELAEESEILTGQEDLPGKLRTLLEAHPGERIVVGDPGHVPAGIYARQALRSLGLWRELSGRLVYAADVRAALALVERGEAGFGIVYATDAALLKGVRQAAVFPEDSHAPIRYAFSRLKAADSGAADSGAADSGAEDSGAEDRLYSFLLSADAREIFRLYGFETEF